MIIEKLNEHRKGQMFDGFTQNCQLCSVGVLFSLLEFYILVTLERCVCIFCALQIK